MGTHTIKVRGKSQEFESQYDTLEEAIEGLTKKIPSLSPKSQEFALDLIRKQSSLSDSQVSWVHRLANEEERSPPLALGLTNISEMLQDLTSSGRPKIKVTDALEVSLNGSTSKHPGHVTITDGGPYKDNIYYGRIDLDGTVHLGRSWTPEVQADLVNFNGPAAAAPVKEESDEDIPF